MFIYLNIYTLEGQLMAILDTNKVQQRPQKEILSVKLKGQ